MLLYCLPIYSVVPSNELQLGNKLAELVLRTEETVNIPDAYTDPRFDKEVNTRLPFAASL